MSRRKFLGIMGLSTLSCTLPWTSGLPSQRIGGDKTNLVFIFTDQHRQDGVGAYNKTPVKTPNLDQLAAEGIRFDNTFTAQPVCAPNRASILSGLYPHSHGVLENTWSLSPRIQTLAEMLGPEGYDCGYYGKWHLDRSHKQGYETFPDYPSDGRGSNHHFTIDGEMVYAVDKITDDAIEFLEDHHDRPFYLHVSFYPPHPPYTVPEKYEELYSEIYPDDEHRRIYYAMCTKVDEQIGRLIGKLHSLGIADNTLVVFTSEHGHFFEQRWNEHEKRLCYDTASRVPLLMKFPGRVTEGSATRELISSVDLTQTILGLLNIAGPQGLQGKDLSDLVTGKSTSGREAVFIENFPYIDKGETPGKYNNEPDWGTGEERCVRTLEWKLILSTVREPELYDMTQDPEEQNNLWAKMKNTRDAAELLTLLHRWGVETGDDLAPQLVVKYS